MVTHPMIARSRPTAEETRTRIVEKADELFRRMGFAKTAVADIAAELGMSPANVYRFFASKNALVQAICDRHLARMHDAAMRIVRSPGPAVDRLERYVLANLQYHKDNFQNERAISDIVVVAMEHNWESIDQHKEAMRTVIELIIRSGIDSGEFQPCDARETARVVFGCLARFCHPLLVQQGIDEDLDAQARATVRFLARALR
ncbi:MAG: TetR family transcriptional regulator [Alphaproteobacteria bacterium]|nr:TetR family transcriptional regulator [Alphaproteobacteria bacterium]